MGLKMNISFILQAIYFIQCYIILISRGVGAFQQKHHHWQVPISRSKRYRNQYLVDRDKSSKDTLEIWMYNIFKLNSLPNRQYY